jgi:hypothetical protein
MARQRLTAATIVSTKKLAAAEKAVDLAHRLLGSGATDAELTRVARRLNASLNDDGVEEIHASVARYAAEMGENFGGDLEDDGQPDPSDTQAMVHTHETTPDVAVSDVAHHENSPTTTISSKTKGTKKVACGTGCGGAATTAAPEPTPKAAATETPKTAAPEPTPKAAATETPKTAAPDATPKEAASEEVVADTAAPEEVVAMEYAEGDTDLEDPKDLEEKDDFLDDEIVDTMDEGDDLEDDEFGDDLDDEDELGGEDELDDEFDDLDDDDFEGDDDDDEEGLDDLDDDDFEGDEDDDDFDDEEGEEDLGLDELESLADLGVDGVMVNKAASKNKKAGKKEAPFRPSRTRVASSGGSRDEMDELFGVPDVGDAFDR